MKSFVTSGVSSIFALALVTVLFGCDGFVDNQLIVNKSDLAVANPAPTTRDFVGNNQKHKVILGVIDTGVDYNHPLLANNIHFKLDEKGNPAGAGYDFTGDDVWPAPVAVRTAYFDPKLTSDERKSARDAISVMEQLLPRVNADIRPLLNVTRHATQEYTGGAYHGTHVAGLMVYDRPDFGLVSYRVIPQNRAYDKSFDYNMDAVTKIAGAIDKSVADGARVVNMSLGMNSERAVTGEDTEAAVGKYEKFMAMQKILMDTIAKYPNVLFVVAAGNENSWRDGLNLTGLPCGIKLPNVLCVGALREDGSPTPFTNMVISGADVVFALGKNVLSTVPTQMCIDKGMEDVVMLEMTASYAKADDYNKAAAKLNAGCMKTPGMGILSGTSMASPLVAHIAAEILADTPNGMALDAKAMIQALYQKATPSFVGTVPVFKLKIKKPSWYAATKTQAMGDSEENQYWEGVITRDARLPVRK